MRDWCATWLPQAHAIAQRAGEPVDDVVLLRHLAAHVQGATTERAFVQGLARALWAMSSARCYTATGMLLCVR